MPPAAIRALGLCGTAIYVGFITWLIAAQPRTVAEIRGGVSATLGTYRIDRVSFDEGLAFFRRDQFEEARAAWQRADPAERDAVTRFYVAYSYYRQGWGRVYSDDALFERGLSAVRQAIALAPEGRLRVDDPDLRMRTADEVQAELQRGLTRDPSDLNPMRLLRERK